MKQTIIIHESSNVSIIAVLDPAAGRRGRYTVHRIYRWADKRADIVGRELSLTQARKMAREIR